MIKINTICLRCGKVQVRTDIAVEIKDKYVQLKNKRTCPYCSVATNHIVTKNTCELRKKLEANPNNKLDSYILKLIKR